MDWQFLLTITALAVIGIAGPAWQSDGTLALISIVLVTLWMRLGFNMIIYLAGLCDGAGKDKEKEPNDRTVNVFLKSFECNKESYKEYQIHVDSEAVKPDEDRGGYGITSKV